MSVPRKILLIGATGQIGSHITDKVVNAQPPFEQVTVFTSPDTASKKAEYLDTLKSKGAKIITGDVNNEQDVKSAYQEVDTVISAVGRDVIAKQIELIRLAEESGTVQWFFPSEYGTDIEHGPQSINEKPHQQKLKVRNYIRENVKRMKVTYLVTGPYPEMWFSLGPTRPEAGGFSAAEKKAILVEDGEGKIGFTSMPDVGKFLVAALRHPEVSQGKALKVQSFVVTPKQVLAEFEKQSGSTDWNVTYSPLQSLRDADKKAWEEGRPDATMFTLRRIWAEGGTLYEKTDNEAIGLKESDAESLESVVKRTAFS